MSADTDSIPWDDVESAARGMFNVWASGSELEWAKECWGHFCEAGLAPAAGLVETTAAYLRLVALAQIYQEFSGCAWDENPDTPVSDLAEDLEIDPVALGILATAGGDRDFDFADDDYALRGAALNAAAKAMRAEIYSCLCEAYGNDLQLYPRMYRTLRSEPDENDGEEFEATGRNSCALQYVQNGFQY